MTAGAASRGRLTPARSRGDHGPSRRDRSCAHAPPSPSSSSSRASTWAHPAHAGRRAFTWVWDTQTVNQGDFELEEWLWAPVHAPKPGTPSPGWLWLAPVYGLTQHVELAFPWEAVVTPAGTQMTDFAAEARIRLYDPNDDQAFVRPLVRLIYQQNFAHPLNAGRGHQYPFAGADVVVSFGDINGSHLTVDAGILADVGFGPKTMVLQNLSLGYTQRLSDEWRLGAEYFHQISIGSAVTGLKHFFAGPDLAFSRGRVWMTFGVLFGLTPTTPVVMPRLIVAVAI